jgi:hypothetical protein
MEEKHQAAHSAIEKCVFSKESNALSITYRFFEEVL